MAAARKAPTAIIVSVSRKTLAAAMPVSTPGPQINPVRQDHDHGLAGDVFSEVSDIIGPQSPPPSGTFCPRTRAPMPEEPLRQHSHQKYSRPATPAIPVAESRGARETGACATRPGRGHGPVDGPNDQGHDGPSLAAVSRQQVEPEWFSFTCGSPGRLCGTGGFIVTASGVPFNSRGLSGRPAYRWGGSCTAVTPVR